MPQLGDIKKGTEIGYQCRSSRYIWHTCEKCGKERWERFRKGKPDRVLCIKCAIPHKYGESSAHWRGGKYKDKNGYISQKLVPSDFFYSMTRHGGYVSEHRLIMAKSLNRCLLPWEVVHHKNGIKDDNRLENLSLLSGQGNHNTMLIKRIKFLEKQVQQLHSEIIKLKE